MHIPDGYLSPATCIVMYGATLPFWYRASHRVQDLLRSRAAPLVAVFAAFVFTIQMFNIPVPGGTTAHAVGGTLMAIVVGPWAAVLGVSVALVIQALFFADGGLTAIGANAFNMAVALPLAGYGVYRLLAGGRHSSVRRRVIAAAVGAYVGVNVAALLVAFELGIQPLLWSVDGRALYSPYGLAATIPTMAITHLTIAGFAEAAVTALALAYLWRAYPALLASVPQESAPTAGRRLGTTLRVLGGALAALVLLTPLGLLAPGGAAFEWGQQELPRLVGYTPEGLAGLAGLSGLAPLPDYQLPSLGTQPGLLAQATAYVLSAVLGAALVFVLVMAARVVLARRPSRS